MKNILKIACILIIPVLSSCPGPKSHDINCTDGFLQIIGVGFAASDFNAAMIVKYKKDNLFDSTIDSGSVTLSIVSSDTCLLWSHSPTLIPGYDYKLWLPAINKTYYITDITQAGQLHRSVPYRDPPVQCVNKMVSCKVNGAELPIDSSKLDLSLYVADMLYLPR